MSPTRGLAAALVAVFALIGCRADTSGLVTFEVPEIAARLGGESAPVLCDANSDDTRRKHGVIPGAVLLSSYRDYDPASELPADRDTELVFYCHSAMCGAAADAARKAVAAGYTRVAVMPDGISGWADAGERIARIAGQGDA